MRKRRYPRFKRLRLTLAVAGLLLGAPVLFPLAMIQYGCTQRRKRWRAEHSRCMRCGAMLGRAALKRSDEEAAARYAEMQRKHPGMRFRLVRKTHAVCGRCGQEYLYAEKRDVLLPLETPG